MWIAISIFGVLTHHVGASSRRCSSSPNRIRFAGLRFGFWHRPATAVSFLSTQDKKKDTLLACLSFWVPPPRGRLYPSVFECSGSAKPPLRRGFACGKTLAQRKAPPARRPVGWSFYNFSRFQNIDFDRPFQIWCGIRHFWRIPHVFYCILGNLKTLEGKITDYGYQSVVCY